MPKKPTFEAWPHQSIERIKLTPELVEGFVQIFLYDRFDSPKQTPFLHREIWRLFCDPYPWVSLAAPRGHAKSTAGTHAFGLASLLFGAQDHVLIISSTESTASDHLKDIGSELEENAAIVEQFKVRLVTSNATEIIGYVGGRMFRLICKGEGQKVRGLKWRHKRPGLILIDDLEEDEAVQNVERRIKLREWMSNAVMPLGSDACIIRAVGTILHFDSWLERTFRSDSEWKTLRFSAHKGFDDFSEILWPEKFPEERLRQIRRGYIAQNNPTGYAQEYLNQPIAELDSYFKRADFTPMSEKDHGLHKNYYVGGDFAISKADRANCTSFTVGGLDASGFLHIVDNHTGRWNALEIIEEMFEIQRLWEPDLWFLEKGQIEKALMPFLQLEMIKRGIFLRIQLMKAEKDKPVRARAHQARMRAGGVKHDKSADWYYPFEMEFLQFPRSGADDRVDATAWLSIGCNQMNEGYTDKELREQEWEDMEEESGGNEGRNETTGY